MQWLHTFPSLRGTRIRLCGACAVDGGHEYLRRSAPSLDDFIDLSVVKLDESADKLFFHNGTAGRGVAAACCFIQLIVAHM